MKSNITHIKELLDKFYECETSESEEEILKEYFRGDVAKEFVMYKPQFQFYDEELDISQILSRNFDSKVLEKINRYESKSALKIKYQKYWYSFAAAASLLIIFGIYSMINIQKEYTQDEYAHTVDALILISSKMELASLELNKLESFEKSLNQLDAFMLLENYGKQIINN